MSEDCHTSLLCLIVISAVLTRRSIWVKLFCVQGPRRPELSAVIYLIQYSFLCQRVLVNCYRDDYQLEPLLHVSTM